MTGVQQFFKRRLLMGVTDTVGAEGGVVLDISLVLTTNLRISKAWGREACLVLLDLSPLSPL